MKSSPVNCGRLPPVLILATTVAAVVRTHPLATDPDVLLAHCGTDCVSCHFPLRVWVKCLLSKKCSLLDSGSLLDSFFFGQTWQPPLCFPFIFEWFFPPAKVFYTPVFFRISKSTNTRKVHFFAGNPFWENIVHVSELQKLRHTRGWECLAFPCTERLPFGAEQWVRNLYRRCLQKEGRKPSKTETKQCVG